MMFERIFDFDRIWSTTAFLALMSLPAWYVGRRMVRAIDRIEDRDAMRELRDIESRRATRLRNDVIGYLGILVVLSAIGWWWRAH